MLIKNVGVSLLVAMLVSACGAGAAVQPAAPIETVMIEKPAPTGEVMAEKIATEAMADKSAEEAVMEPEASPAAMEEKEGMAEAAMTEEAPVQEATMGAKPTEAQMAEKNPTAEAMAETPNDDETMAIPAWFNVELTDVNSGEVFKIADLKGKVVLVETMAVWCPLCLQQQKQVRALHELLGEREDLVSLALDIDPNEDAAFLQAHASQNGFDWRYAVAPPEVSREIGQLYSAQFLNPPSTPMLIIDRQGEVHLLPFGQKDAQTLQEAVTPLLNEG